MTIERVSSFSTGTVQIRPEHVGPTRKNTYWWLLTSQRWTAPRPINVFVVEHRDGVVLFDTGQDRSSVTDPDYFPTGLTGFLYSRLARFDIPESATLKEGLRRLGLGTNDIAAAVISHLHQDHIGGIREIQGADLLVSQEEWQSLRRPLPELRGLLTSHIDLPGSNWITMEMTPLRDAQLAPFTHGHDIFDDGSVVVLPTPGHTPGSVSMLVRPDGGRPLLMVGDLTYDHELLAHGHLPGVGERRVMRDSIGRINQLKASLPGLVVLPTHDPSAARRLIESESLTHRFLASNGPS